MLLLDGPTGTVLAERGVDTPAPLWSAQALLSAPQVLAGIHADYARAGATVHTAATFRTKRRAAGPRWEALARQAVQLVREAVPHHHQVAGSLAPLEDCYHPERSPPRPGPEHAELAAVLADAGCDIILCETFPHIGEAVAATHAAAGRGVPVWTALTAGYRGDLLTPAQAAEGARRVVDAGAEAVFINCTPAAITASYVEAIVKAVGGQVSVGAYANAGAPEDGAGWGCMNAPAHYARLATTWRDAGASILGGCCGTGPATIAALARQLQRDSNTSS